MFLLFITLGTEGTTGIWGVGAGDATELLTTHRNAPHPSTNTYNNHLAQRVNSAEVEKPRSALTMNSNNRKGGK